VRNLRDSKNAIFFVVQLLVLAGCSGGDRFTSTSVTDGATSQACSGSDCTPSGNNPTNPGTTPPVAPPIVKPCTPSDTPQPLPSGIVLLNPAGQGTLDITGSGSLSVNASVNVNSKDTAAGVITGSGSATALGFYFVGNYKTTGNGKFVTPPGGVGIKTGVNPLPDPLQYVPSPDPKSLTIQSTSLLNISGGAHELKPGVYQGGISVNGDASVVLDSGIYYLDGGGFTVTGSGSVSGKNVSFYNAGANDSDSISLTGSGNLALSPPSSGAYQGLTIFQNRTSMAEIDITGSGDFNIQGAIYAASANLKVTGSGDASRGSQYVLGSLGITGSGGVNLKWDGSIAPPVCLK
jgi:hypothetical protein